MTADLLRIAIFTSLVVAVATFHPRAASGQDRPPRIVTVRQPPCRQPLVAPSLLHVAGVDGVSRWPAAEIMIATDAVRALIRKGDDHQLRSQISVGKAEGMTTMEQSLAELVRLGRITRETAIAHCFRNDDLQRYLA